MLHSLKKGIFSTIATWLSCEKHGEDDVTRKFNDLRVGDLDKEFLLDIFGSDARKETGLIDPFTVVCLVAWPFFFYYYYFFIFYY